MFFKIFLPFLVLLVIQLIGFVFYNGFSLEMNSETRYLVVATYLISIVFLILSSIFYRIGRVDLNNKNNFNKPLGFLIFLLVLVFLNKPTIILYFLGQSLGVDYVRNNFFIMESLRAQAFGSGVIAAFTLMYVAPILWFFCIYLIGSRDRLGKYLFYYILFSLVLFNMSYAGRFNLYFAVLIIYLKALMEGESILIFVKKYALLVASFLFLSLIILVSRSGDNYESNSDKEILTLVEYHLMQPFFWAQKIEGGIYLPDSYPFKLIIESILFPFFFFVGKSFSDISYGLYINKFSDFTLYSNQTENFYNAFATMYAYLYSDFGYFTPIFFVFFMTFILVYSFFIKNKLDRVKYISFFSLMLYFSLFQSPIFSPGCLLVLLISPFFLRYKLKL